MSVYKDEKTGKWYALAWYHDWKGEGRQKCKRGFETKKAPSVSLSVTGRPFRIQRPLKAGKTG